MPPVVTLLVSVTIFMVMFSLGLDLNISSLSLSRHRTGVLVRILIGTCLLVPLAGLVLLELPLLAGLSPPAKYAITLMVICPSAPLALRRVSSSGGRAGLATLIQVAAAIVAIISIPLMVALFQWVKPVEGWDITPAGVALQVTRVQLIPLAAGLLVKAVRPGWVQRWIGAISRLATALLLFMILVLLGITSSSLIPFLTQYLLALPVMLVMVAISLAIGYVLAGQDPIERNTVALVTSTRNLGLAAQLAVVYGSAIKGLIPALLSYTLMSIVLSTAFLKLRTGRRSS